MKNILICVHADKFYFNDGGTVVQYLLAKYLDELGLNVRICHVNKFVGLNPIYSKFYKNDFPIDDNTVVIYCEGIYGNPLNAKNVVRWMLSKLGQNVPYDWVHSWGKNELVYYFNSEEKIAKNPDKFGNIYKLLSIIYINPSIVNYNIPNRKGICFTIRKSFNIRQQENKIIHPPGSFEITREHSQDDYIKIFNKHKYFICYDSITFLIVISALCGCIPIIVKVDGLSKNDWVNTTAAADYLKETGEPTLYGIAYGFDDIINAVNTIHMVKEQWDRIVNFYKTKYVTSFINDIENWNNNINTISNNFY